MNATLMRLAAAVLAAVVGGSLCRAAADTLDVSLPPFYEAAARLPATGKLGQVLAKESVPTAIEGALADGARSGAARRRTGGGTPYRRLGARNHRHGAELRTVAGRGSGAAAQPVFPGRR